MSRSSVKKYYSVLIMLIIFTFHISAAEEVSLKTGICRFQTEAEADSILANGVSAAFFETVRLIYEHQLNSEEIKAFLSKSKENEIKQKLVEIEKIYSERDKIIFTVNSDNLAEKLKASDQEIAKKKEEILEIRNKISDLTSGIKDDSLTVMPLEFKQPENGRYFTHEVGEIEETAKKNNIDLLVYGFIEKLEDYSFIEVRLWNNLLKKDTVVWRTAVSSENVNELIAEGRNIIKSDLLGREWSELTVRGPDNCLIYLDGEFSGIGIINALIMNPGSVVINVRKNGYYSEEKTVLLESGTEKIIGFELEQKNLPSVVIQTFPANADVYLDSVWMGLSPVRLEPGNEISAIRIKKEGFVEQNFFIDNMTERIININMKADSSGREQWVPDARKRFYAGFGSFILSIPFTALFYSMVEQTGDAYKREYESHKDTNSDELIRLANLNFAQYSLYLASLGLNIIMFLDTIIQAVEYVNSVEYFSF